MQLHISIQFYGIFFNHYNMGDINITKNDILFKLYMDYILKDGIEVIKNYFLLVKNN